MSAGPTDILQPATPEPAERATGLFHPQPRAQVVEDMVERARRRLEGMSDGALEAYMEDVLWNERNRLKKAHDEEEEQHLDRLARALVRGTREERIDQALTLVGDWTDEIHGRFNPRVYGVATRALPRMLSALLSRRPRRLASWDLSPTARLKVKGEIGHLRTLSREATLILCPTHVSNLDSPLIGLALYLAGLPPFVYGAGLNLFSNKVIGWWMHRLGAYTVDRTKKARLYKDVLKDYSIRALTTRHHSLFFPGGTRSRSGEVETSLKKGLLGTGVVAWQEMLEAGRRDSEIYVVPLTLSFTLVLEAATLIEDHLAEAGKQRYIIADDEFTQPRRLASFARRVLDLDSAVIAHFGQPLDVLGNPVSYDAHERAEQAIERRAYVCDADGRVEWDPQRDRVYTDRLASALGEAYVRHTDVLSTHAAAWAAWECLVADVGSRDPFRLVRVPMTRRAFPVAQLTSELRRTLDRVHQGARAGLWHEALPSSAEETLDIALDRFGRYHKTRALARDGDRIVVEDPKLCLYYRNRLTFLDRVSPEDLRSIPDPEGRELLEGT